MWIARIRLNTMKYWEKKQALNILRLRAEVVLSMERMLRDMSM